MDHLCKYIEWFIRKRITENPVWQNIEVIYSSASVPSEGEQKAMCYIRNHGKNNESFVLHGLDADLIMLSLLTHFPKFYVLRDDTFDRYNNFLLLDINSVRNQLIDIMKWKFIPEIDSIDEHYKFIPEWAINDFVFLCFLCGNDFLPHMPSLEIVEGGIEVILQICKSVSEKHGHITRNTNGNIVFCKVALGKFLEIVAESEKALLEQKMKHQSKYFPDELLVSCSSFQVDKHVVDIEKYREKYNQKHFEGEDLEKVCHSYLNGMQWILSYYTKEVPSWRWYYKYHYAPCASEIIKHIESFSKPRYHRGTPSPPFLQLMSILPPQSSDLLPKAMNKVLKIDLKKHFPDKIEIDLSGKKQEYQGIVLLPFVEHSEIKKVYDDFINKVDEKEMKRNVIGKSVLYKYNESSTRMFYSYYGNIVDCKAEFKIIEM